MGGFHALCIFQSIIGKRFTDAGLKDIIVESGLLGENAAMQVLKGKEYNNAMHVHMYVAEDITRGKIEGFENWLCLSNKFERYAVIMSTTEVDKLKEFRNSQSFQDETIYPKAVFWNSYLGMVQTLRDFAKSITNGDWDLNMHTSEKMLYWFHAYDHYNYSQHFSYYWPSQQVLAETHPGIFQQFKDGNFSVRRKHGRFNKISPEQLIEQTINKY